MALELRQIEGGRRALRQLRLGVVEDIEAEIEQRARHFLAVDENMGLRQMPAARPHHEQRRCRADVIVLAGRRIGEADRAGPAVLQIDLAFDDVGPGRRVRILEIRHEDLGAGIERIDDHFPVDRAGDLDAAVLEIGGNRRDAPLRLADRPRLFEKIRQFPGIEALLAFGAERQQSKPLAVEAAMQGERGIAAPRASGFRRCAQADCRAPRRLSTVRRNGEGRRPCGARVAAVGFPTAVRNATLRAAGADAGAVRPGKVRRGALPTPL